MVATVYNRLASSYTGLGNYQKATEYYQTALNIRLRAFGKYHPKVVDSYGWVSMAYDKENKPDQRLAYLIKSVEANIKPWEP